MMRYILLSLLGLFALAAVMRLAVAQFPGPIASHMSVPSNPALPPQTISSITPATCSIATGATGTCATMTVTMSPASPAFTPGGTLAAVSATGSGGICTHTSDTADFGFSGLNLNLTNASAAAGTDYICVSATKSGVPTKYQEVTATVTGGGGGPTVPAVAQAANLTTLAANYDFSQPLYATQSNWLDCGNNNPSLTWHWGSPGIVGPLPCNIFQGTDGGLTVLHMQYLQSYSSYGQSAQNNFVHMWTRYSPTGTNTADFPQNIYVEVVSRDASVIDTTGNQNSGPNSVYMANGSGGVDGMEYDIYETYAAVDPNGYSSAGWLNWLTNGSSWVWTSFSNQVPINVYHTYGFLITSNGATSIYVCAYVDGVLQSCQDTGAVSAEYSQRNYLIAEVGGNFGGSGYPPQQDVYIQYIRVWSCANWNSSSSPANQCNGSVLFNSGGLTYWH